MANKCEVCGVEVEGNEHWRTLCRKHFIEKKRAEELDRMQELDSLRRELAAIKRGDRTKREVTPDKVRKLIQLCHPDKHNGSTASVEITQWLLELKKDRDGR